MDDGCMIREDEHSAAARLRRRLPHRGRGQLALASRADSARRGADPASQRTVQRGPLTPIRLGKNRDRAGRPHGRRAADAARRPLTKAWRGLPAIVVVTALAGCAAAGGPTLAGDEEIPRRSAAADPRADAYYAYSVAQMHVQAGRFKEAVPLMRNALKRDPNSATLWTQFAQLLVRADNLDEAVSAARRAVELAPDQMATRMTLAELLRAQRKYAEAEAELERAIALSPNSEEPYLMLARIQVEQKAYDRARSVLLRLVEQQPGLAQAQ